MTQTRNFWSRRREAVQAEEQAALLAEDAHTVDMQRAALEEKDDAEILAELNLPDPDNLTIDDDVSGFMSKVVPDRLRRRALRKLWRLNPVLANVDGLVDYGEDYTDAATVIENLQTTYQVGKGMLAHVQELARQAEAKSAADEDSDEIPEIPPNAEVALVSNTDTDAEPTAKAEAKVETETQQEQSDTQYAAPIARRMRFEFEG